MGDAAKARETACFLSRFLQTLAVSPPAFFFLLYFVKPVRGVVAAGAGRRLSLRRRLVRSRVSFPFAWECVLSEQCECVAAVSDGTLCSAAGVPTENVTARRIDSGARSGTSPGLQSASLLSQQPRLYQCLEAGNLKKGRTEFGRFEPAGKQCIVLHLHAALTMRSCTDRSECAARFLIVTVWLARTTVSPTAGTDTEAYVRNIVKTTSGTARVEDLCVCACDFSLAMASCRCGSYDDSFSLTPCSL